HEQGILFISINERIDLTTSVGKLQFHIIAAFAEFEREMIVDGVNSGIKAKQERVRQGKDTWNGRGPDTKMRRRPIKK
ncbi:MAG: recombinase family protein, partial [bacterium]